MEFVLTAQMLSCAQTWEIIRNVNDESVMLPESVNSYISVSEFVTNSKSELRVGISIGFYCWANSAVFERFNEKSSGLECKVQINRVKVFALVQEAVEPV